jgi:hypothetical protein
VTSQPGTVNSLIFIYSVTLIQGIIDRVVALLSLLNISHGHTHALPTQDHLEEEEHHLNSHSHGHGHGHGHGLSHGHSHADLHSEEEEECAAAISKSVRGEECLPPYSDSAR